MQKEADWEKLERKIKDIFKDDKAKTVPGSGNGKGEEDVIGVGTISQCKFSDNKNVSILAKDIDRLHTAAKMQGKTPIFVNENDGKLVLSFLEGPLLRQIVEAAVLLSQCGKVLDEIEDCESIRQYHMISKFISTSLEVLGNRVIGDMRKRLSDVNKKLKIKFDDLSQGDLFEGV